MATIQFQHLSGFITLIAIPMVIVIGIITFLKKRREGRSLFPKGKDDIIPRPPGWSLRQRLDLLKDQLDQWLLMLVIIPAAVGVLYMTAAIPMWIGLIAVIVFSLYTAWRLHPLIKTIRNHRLGLYGEEVVGTKLAPLWGNGWAVYHDLVIEKTGRSTWNIDHVVLAPNGVFVVETKCRRRPKGIDGHKVTFDGTSLQFPFGSEKWGLDQAKRNAEWLSGELEKVTAEPVSCFPVLTLPGWWITESKLGPVRVLSPKGIEPFIAGKPVIISDQQQSRIRKWLNDHCQLEIE